MNRRLFALPLAAFALVTAAHLAGAATASPVSAAPTSPVTPPTLSASAVISANAPALGVLRPGLVGLSFESNADSGGVNSGRFDDVGDLPALMRNLGAGTLRFGGNSVDKRYTGATPAALAGLRRLAQVTGWRVLYSENLAHGAPAADGADAAAVAEGLGTYLAGIACGNEPNLYPGRLRPPGWGLAQYLPELDACLRAVHAAAPAAILAGPDAEPPLWQADTALAERSLLGRIDAHYYPLTNCVPPIGTINDLLSASTRAAQAQYMNTAGVTAKAAGLPWAMTETNSASCSGIPGVSDTFAAALWALDYVLTAAEHGADGVEFHSALDPACAAYSPMCATGAPNQYAPRPLYYGLLAVHLFGTGTLYPAEVTDSSGHLAAHAIRTGDSRWRLALENLGPTPMTVTIQTPASPTASIDQLTSLSAASPTSTTGVMLQGADTTTAGDLERQLLATNHCHKGICTTTLAAYSAALLTIR